MKPLHEELKELRLEQNLTLKDVALKTRIRLDFLERLEGGDYAMAPMPFVRAFIREYAEVVGADPTLAMAKLDRKIDTILAPKPAGHDDEEQTSETDVPSVEETAPDTGDTETAGQTISEETPVDETPDPSLTGDTGPDETEPSVEPVDPEEQASTVPVRAEVQGTHEVELSENGALSETVRRPLVIEEENSLSNMVFVIIIVGLLIIAGVLMFLNRGNLF